VTAVATKRNVTDRALRYRANATPPPKPNRCIFCNSSKVEVGHLNGHEEDNDKRNLVWTCRPCNVKSANTLRKKGLGRLTRQYNPAGGAENLGQWMNAISTVKGDGGSMELSDAIAMIHSTSPAKRSELQKEVWGVRRTKYGDKGRKNGACMKRKKNFLGFGGGSKVMSSSRLSKDAYNQGYLGKKEFNSWLTAKTKDDNLHSSAVRELRRQFDLGNSDRLAHEQQKNQLALLKQAKRESPKPAAPPKGEKLTELGEEYKGRNIKRTAKGFEVLGETWNTKAQAREFVDLYNITGGKVRTKTNPKRKANPEKKEWIVTGHGKVVAQFDTKSEAEGYIKSMGPRVDTSKYHVDDRSESTFMGSARNAGPRSHRKTKKEAHKRMGIAGKQPKPAAKKNAAAKQSEAYKAGIESLRAAASRAGTVNLSPSTTQREDWKHDWSQFMAGWNAEKRRKENPSSRKNFADSYIKGKPSTAEITQGKAKAQIYQTGSKSVATVIAANGAREEHTFNGQGSFKAAMSWARLRLHEVANPAGGWKLYPLSAKPRRKNPEDASVRMYEKFHGLPSTEVREYQEEFHRHEWLSGLGPLTEMVVLNVHGNKEMTLNAPEPDTAKAGDVVMLCVEETGTQLYCTGGDQGIDFKVLKQQFGMVDTDVRDNMLIGTIKEITYRTRKKFEKNGKEVIDFYHALGSEGSRGVYPVLVYHPRDERMEIVGGRYYVGKVAATLGNTSPGLIG
jgi:hypothetical protein